jgi:hypothetical protein
MWLADRYQQDIDALNKAWNLDLNSFENLKSMTFKDYPSTMAIKTFMSFPLSW